MRIVTWNVNSLRARLPRVLQLLAQHEPDVVCLQETKCTPDGFPEAELAAGRIHGRAPLRRAGGRGLRCWRARRCCLPIRSPGCPASPPRSKLAGARPRSAACGSRACTSPTDERSTAPSFPRKLAFLDAIAARAQALRGHPLLDRRRFQHRPRGPRRLRPGSVRRLDARNRGRARPPVGDPRSGPPRRLPSPSPNRGSVHLVGLPRRQLPPRPRSPHRPRAVQPDLADRELSCGIDRDYRKGTKPSDHAPLLLELDLG